MLTELVWIFGHRTSTPSETLGGAEGKVSYMFGTPLKALTGVVETPGEDPYHLSSYVHALIKGLQGDSSDPYKRVVATCKHYAGTSVTPSGGLVLTMPRI